MSKRYTDADNERILQKIANFLTFTPDAITPELIREMRIIETLSEEDAFAHLLAAMTNAGESDAEAHALYTAYFRPMVKRLDHAAYSMNPYLAAIRDLRAVSGSWTLKQKRYKPYEAFVAGEPRTLEDGRVLPEIGFFDRAYAYPALLENGREWMEITPNEIITMRGPIDASFGNVLTYGLGLGYYAFMASEKPSVRSVTVVERSETVLSLFRQYILPHFPHPEKMRLVHGDAFEYQACEVQHRGYDVIFTDLWHDPSDGIELMRRMKALEGKSPKSRYLYWIEDTLRLYEGAEAE